MEDQLNAEYKPGVLAIHHARKPWIAAVNGPCAGISYSYAMACDLMVMAEAAIYSSPSSVLVWYRMAGRPGSCRISSGQEALN